MLGVIGSIISGVIGIAASKKAAKTEEKGAKTATAAQKVAADKALAISKTATDRSLAVQKQQYDQIRDDLKPYRLKGTEALKELFDARGELTRPFTMEDFEAEPGYEFVRSEGEKAIQRSLGAATDAAGTPLSGQVLKALQRYNTDLASAEYGKAYNRFQDYQGNRFNRLRSLADIGETAVGRTVNAAGNYGVNAGNALLQQGVNAANIVSGLGGAQAQGALNAAAARSGGIMNAANAATQGISSGIENYAYQDLLRRYGYVT